MVIASEVETIRLSEDSVSGSEMANVGAHMTEVASKPGFLSGLFVGAADAKD
jgi:hypothetical protein